MEKNYLTYEIDKLVEENRKLRSENRGFQELLSVNQDLIFRYHTIEKVFEYISPTSVVLTGFAPADFYQRPGLLEELVDEDFRVLFREHWTSACFGRKSPELEFRIRRPDDSTRWAALRSWPVMNRIGKVIAFVGSLRDISRQKEMEERIRTLEGLIPICSGCKKIRLFDGSWEDIESYLSRRSNMDFTHGLCAECRTKYFPS